MKTTSLKALKRYRDDKLILKVHIQLNDECGNGHADFAITADGYEKNERGVFKESFGGCCHDEILKYFPELKPFVDLHLSDSSGVPMYAIANGFYHLKNEEKTEAERKQIVKNHLRINDTEFEVIKQAEDQEHFHYLVEKLDLPYRWKREALGAIVTLEKMSGKEWDHAFQWTRETYKPMGEDARKAIENHINEGYYSKSKIKARAEQKRKDKINAKIKAIQEDLKKSIAKKTLDADLKIWLIQKIEKLRKKDKTGAFLVTQKNVIYYNHSNELHFNWVDYEPQATKEDFRVICESLTKKDLSLLPEDITLKLKCSRGKTLASYTKEKGLSC